MRNEWKVFQVVGLIAAASMLGADLASADALDGDVTVDSSIVVVEQGGYGSYRERTVEIAIRDGQASLRVVTDGVEQRRPLSLEDCVGLWETLRANGISELTDSQPAQIYPDGVAFQFTGRVGSSEHRFVVLDPNRVEDVRYRELLGRILRTAEPPAEAAE